MQSSSMRSIGAKSFGYNIEQMKWSNKMDLIAFSNSKNEVIVQRLNWQNLWVHPPPTEHTKVRGIDWRPDERILAIGYNSGLVTLVDVENQQEIHNIKLDSDIACLSWTQNTSEYRDGNDDPLDNRMFQEPHEVYLPPLPSFHALSSNARKIDYNSMKSYCTKVFNILLVGLRSGIINMYVFGVLSCGKIDIAKYLRASPDEFEIVDVRMTIDFRSIFVFVKHEMKLKKIIVENDIFAKRMQPLLRLAAKHGHILCTMTYIEDIIQCITEAWESALLEMDNKLTKYANSRMPHGMISAEFLELLMFGYSSTQLEQFLRKDLTEKGLKKLGNSIEISYSTIQQLVVKPLHTGILNICFHLNSIKGMSANSYNYKQILGTVSSEASRNAGAFLIKSLELQQAIEQSTRDYKIFWGWLYGVIIRFLETSVPDEAKAVSQQDITYLAEFLSTFDQDARGEPATGTTKRTFNLERVGQYLKNENLSKYLVHDTSTEWSRLLEENECLKSSDIIYPHHKELSLVQEHNLLKESLAELFSKPEKYISEQFKLKMCVDIVNIDMNDSIKVEHINFDSKKASFFLMNVANAMVFIVEHQSKSDFVKLIKLEFTQMPYVPEQLQIYTSMRFCDVRFYNESTLSMLIATRCADAEQETKCFVQYPIHKIQPRLLGLKMAENIDISHLATGLNFYELLDTNLLRPLEVHDGHLISVSGNRKIASVLSESRKRLRHYEMEVEEDEDENEVSQNNESLDVSGSGAAVAAAQTN